MVVLSKIVDEIRYFKCEDLLHKGSCTNRCIFDSYHFLISNIKYFAPTIFLPLLVKVKDINQGRVIDALKFYLSTTMAGTCTGCIISTVMCILRNLLGEFKLYSLTYLPTLIGALAVYPYSERTFTLFKVSTFQMFIEIFLKRQSNSITRAIFNSIKWQTLIFMLCSAIIMEAKRRQVYKGFWLLQPTAKKHLTTENDEAVSDDKAEQCQHVGYNCMEYLRNGLRSYMAIGVTLDIIKCGMANVPKDTTGVLNVLLGKIKQFRLSTTFLFALYLGIYRWTNCFLNRRAVSLSFVNNHVLASFLSGICYALYPKQTLLTYAISVTLEICWSHWRQQKSAQDTDVIKLLKRLPLDKILYPFCLANVVHVYTFRPQYATKFSSAIINGLTNNYAKNIATIITALERNLEQGIKRVVQ